MNLNEKFKEYVKEQIIEAFSNNEVVDVQPESYGVRLTYIAGYEIKVVIE